MKASSNPNTEKIVYFVRHGQSEANVSPSFQGPDSPLSSAGKEQAEFIAERMTHVDFETLVSSPWLRAKQTAEVISSKVGKPVDISELFVERVKPASLNDKPYDDPQATKTWEEYAGSFFDDEVQVENGEGYSQIIDRVDDALGYLYQLPAQRIAVVTHGYFLASLVARVLLKDTLTSETYTSFHNRISMQNTGVTVITYEPAYKQDPDWRLWIYNDHAHLAE